MSEENRPSVLTGVASYIIVTEFCERLAYYGFAGSLVLFFQTQLNYSNEQSVNSFYLWNGMVYVTPLFGGYLADTKLGRFNTILIFSFIYLIGLVCFVFGTIPTNVQPLLIFGGMYIVSVGAGGIKPNCSTMGADQFDLSYPRDVVESKQFFSYFYWAINLGALFAYTGIAYICQYGAGESLGGQEWGFFVGYILPTVMLAIGIIIFVSASKKYRKLPPQGSMLSLFAGLIWEAFTLPELQINKKTSSKATSSILKQSIGNHGGEEQLELVGVANWLDKAKKENGGNYFDNEVESAKYIVRLFPFLFVMIPYWGIYGQTKTAFQIMGCQMNSNINGISLPISSMNIFNNLAILILVPLFEAKLYPYLKNKGVEMSMLRKIGFGFGFAIAGMIAAALLEMVRQKYTPGQGNWYDVAARDNISPCRNIDNFSPVQYQNWYATQNDSTGVYEVVDVEPSNCSQISGCNELIDGLLSEICIQCDDIPQMSDISILWQIPLFVFIGISEIFASITSLEFFYSQAPSSVRSVSQSANLLTSALGSWLTIPLTLAVNFNPNDLWVASNIDNGHLNYYFFLLALLMVLTLNIFLYISKGFKYANPQVLAHLSRQEDSITTSLLSEERQNSNNEGSYKGRNYSYVDDDDDDDDDAIIRARVDSR